MKTKTVSYQDGNVTLEGYYAYDDKSSQQRPAVLVAHDWTGNNNFARKKAEKLAELGYVGFALDMYGDGKLGKNKEEKVALMQPLMDDRAKLMQRITAAFEAVKTLEVVDKSKIGAIGFCFGGLCVLDLARSGADVRGVVSFHGLLKAPEKVANKKILASVLVLHGYDDPMVKPDQVVTFGDEMTTAKVDWQLDIYGNTMHGFTNPEANDPGFGTVYNPDSDARSWIAMREFFKAVFNGGVHK